MKRASLSVLCLFLVISAISQKNPMTEIPNFLNLGKEGIKDIEQLTELYLNPYGKGYSSALAGGWNNTAKTHRLLGFDFNIGLTMAMIPKNDKSFNFDDYKWKVLKPESVERPVTPTIAGKQTNRPSIGFHDKDKKIRKDNLFTMPDGTGLGFAPLPLAQLGVGIIGKTDLQVRIAPPLKISDFGELFVFGAGIKHDIKQWIPVLKKIPVIDISLAFNYSIANNTINNIKYFPDADGLGIPTQIDERKKYIDNELLPDVQLYKEGKDLSYFKDQELKIKMNAFSASLLASATVPILTLYCRLGFSTSTTNVKLAGTYLLPNYIVDQGKIHAELRKENEIKDPIDIDMKLPFSPLAGIGARAKFALFTVHAEYTYQDYHLLNFGVGLTFR